MDYGFLARLNMIKSSLKKSSKDISTEIGLSKSYISEIFSGKKDPNFEFMIGLSSKYKISLDWLVTGKGDMFFDENMTSSKDERFDDELRTIKEMITGIMSDKALFNEIIFRLKHKR